MVCYLHIAEVVVITLRERPASGGILSVTVTAGYASGFVVAAGHAPRFEVGAGDDVEFTVNCPPSYFTCGSHACHILCM